MNGLLHPTLAIVGYQLIGQLYNGSRTVVYRGVREHDGCPVIIKLLKHTNPTFQELLQFRNQYTIAKHLNCPGLIQVYSLEAYHHSYALVMEDFGGIALSQYVQTHHLSLIDILNIALQLADILHSLYLNRVIHKDIKPANILIHPETQQIKVIDFSVATLLPKETAAIKNPSGLEGTLAYLAPEQTGRMNRGIDYRSDFYALGVTLFKLLTHRLPFEASDPMELVHCHIAQQPPLVHQLKPEVPEVISAIVHKLMAKNAEDRYQSALGLKWDLTQCVTQLTTTGNIEPFSLGQRDVCDRFLIPEKLYGREAEVAELLAAFDRISGSGGRDTGTSGSVGTSSGHTRFPQSELILVAGFSGIGKTAVVNEVHKPIVRQRGYFIKGKFDQFNRSTPLLAFVQAIRDLMGQLLSESVAQIESWRTQILSALGDSAQIMLDVIPELEYIIGPQPAAPELSGLEAQNRFNRLFLAFIQIFMAREHPLVIFLDDLQWADSGSLKLLQLLMGDAHQGYLLLIGAYRNNEVFAAHPLMLTIEGIRKGGAAVSTLTLEPLQVASLNQLVADTLGYMSSSDADEKIAIAKPLTHLIHQKTKGNPFFVTQFLTTLHQEGLITFDTQAGYWVCDMTQVQATTLTNNVVELMVQRLQKLSAQTQHMLKLAACIGSQFDLATLAIVSDQTPSEASEALWEALQSGLILPQSDVYKFYWGEDQAVSQTQIANLSYKFLHDRIQQAAYCLITEDQRPFIHCRIGLRLLRHSSVAEQEDHLFEIANHLNLGDWVTTQQIESEELCQINLMAGRKAKAATAYGAAMNYLQAGMNLLGEAGWHQNYDLTLTLHLDCLEATCLNTEFGQLEALGNAILTHAHTLLDTIRVYEIWMIAARSQAQFLRVVEIGLEVLHQLGVDLPPQPTPEEIGAAGQATYQLWTSVDPTGGRSPLALLDLPDMEDPQCLAAMKILTRIVSSAYVAAPTLLPLLIFKQLDLSVQQGNCPVSIFAYVDYGLILCGVMGDIEVGYTFGQIATTLLERFQATPFKSRVLFVNACFIQHWQEPLHQVLPHFLEGYQIGLETGDIESACLNLATYSQYAYCAGHQLADLATQMESYHLVFSQLKQPSSRRSHAICYQVVLNLMGQAEHPHQLSGPIIEEQHLLSELQADNDRTGLSHLYFNKAILAYLFEHYDEAAHQSALAEQYSDAWVGYFFVPLVAFYDALIQLARYREATPEHQTILLETLLEKVHVHHANLQRWAGYAPANHQHRVALLEAEISAVQGDRLRAIDAYDQAIALAQRHGYDQDEALAHELAARFYLAWGKTTLAQPYLRAAYAGYARWGAKAKTDALERRYPHVLCNSLDDSIPRFSPFETLESVSEGTLLPPVARSHTSSSSVSDALDFTSALKAAQAMASTIQLEELIVTLSEIILKTSGAQTCVLILPDQPDWQVRAIAVVNESGKVTTQLDTHALDDCPDVPAQLVRYVKNTLTPVISKEGEPHLPGELSDYMVRHQPQSVMCAPIVNQGNLVGILYLEHRLAKGIFNHERLLVLNFLCTQAAISLKNAQLYTDLQENEARFQKLANNVPGLIYRLCLSPDGSAYMPYVSLGCAELYGVSAALVMSGQYSLCDFEHPDDQASITHAMIESAQNLTTFSHEWRIITPSGQMKWVQAVSQPERQADGSILWDGIVLDISDRKQAEVERQQIAAEQARLLAILESTPDLIGTANPAGQTLYINQAWRNLWGIDQADLLPLEIPQFHPDWALEIIGGYGIPEAARSGIWSGETAVLDASGREIPVSQIILAHKSPTGEVEYFSTIARDISDRKAAEAALKISEKNLRTIFDHANNAIFVYSLDGQLVDVNDRMLEMYRMESRTQALNLTALDYSAPDNDFDQALLFWERALTGETVQCEWKAKCPTDGYEFDIEITLTNITLDGSEVILASVQDISERKRAELALRQKSAELSQTLEDLKSMQLQLVQNEKMSALGNLVAGVAHEINNPVGFLNGNIAPAQTYVADLFGLLDLYQQKFPQPGSEIEDEIDTIDLAYLRDDLPKLISSMKLGVDRIREISNSLRTFSRADKDYKTKFNVHDGLNSTLLILKHRLKATETRPEIEIIKTYGNLPTIECFPGQLNQVFMNILANAIDALEESNQGKSFAQIRANPNRIEVQTSLNDSGTHALIRIRDNGTGMAEETQAHIFDHLFTTKGVGQGTGLGLAIAYQIVVEKHGGTIEVTSALGQSTEFTISLPLKG